MPPRIGNLFQRIDTRIIDTKNGLYNNYVSPEALKKVTSFKYDGTITNFDDFRTKERLLLSSEHYFPLMHPNNPNPLEGLQLNLGMFKPKKKETSDIANDLTSIVCPYLLAAIASTSCIGAPALLTIGSQMISLSEERTLNQDNGGKGRKMTLSNYVSLSNLPPWVQLSKKYRDLFNKISNETGTNTVYPEDIGSSRTSENPNGVIKEINQLIEMRRRRVAKAAYMQLLIQFSDSLAHMDKLNPAERKWCKEVNSVLVHESLIIYGKQAHHSFELMNEWMMKYGDAYSLAHFIRMRSIRFPILMEKALEGLDFPDPEEYGNPFPWFPDSPTYSAMWPHDLSKDELEYINKIYPLEDPIRQTYTVVERLDPNETKRILSKPLKNDEGTQVEWIRKGLGNRYYKVVNIVFHPRFRSHFLKMAETLKTNAKINSEGTTLDPQFEAFTLTMAKTFENGDFPTLLKEDLKQTNGNLFLTAFPHESYWGDGIKFPFLLEVAVRDQYITDMIKGNTDILEWLEIETSKKIRQYNTDYSPRLMRPEDIYKSAVFGWAVAFGGDMRASDADPGGHDYPKRPYPTITGHRTVLLLDVLKSWMPIMETVGNKMLNPNDAKHITFDGLIEFGTWHEGSHGTGNRESTPTTSGRNMSEVFEEYWGLQAETYADSSSFLIMDKLHQTLTEVEYSSERKHLEQLKADNKISLEEYNLKLQALDDWHKKPRITDKRFREGIVSGLTMLFRRALPKDLALKKAYQTDNPHGVGSNVMLGWLYENKAVKMNKKGQLSIVWKKLIPTIKTMRDKLIEFASTDNLEGFISWCNERVNAIPDLLENRIIQVKKSVSVLVVLDRGFGLVPHKVEEK